MAKIEIFSGPGCSHCESAKLLLRRKGLAHIDLDISEAAQREEFARRLPRTKSIPQIFVDGAHIGGDEDLRLLDESGRLDVLTGRE